jgi:hypothetical protein
VKDIEIGVREGEEGIGEDSGLKARRLARRKPVDDCELSILADKESNSKRMRMRIDISVSFHPARLTIPALENRYIGNWPQ